MVIFLWQRTLTVWQAPIKATWKLMPYAVCKHYVQVRRMSWWSKGVFPVSSFQKFQVINAANMSNDTSVSQSSTTTIKGKQPPNDTLGIKILKGIARLFGFYSKTAMAQRAAANIYKCCADDMKYEDFLKLCNMPDTFQSWFLVLQLHVWMCLVRLKQNGKEGRIAYRTMVSVMWDDVEERMKSLGVDDPSTRKESLKICLEEFYGLIVAYDEGLVSGDRVLAAALWRNMISDKKDTDLPGIAILTRHVRKQVHALDQLDSKKLLTEGVIEWLPLEATDSLQK